MRSVRGAGGAGLVPGAFGIALISVAIGLATVISLSGGHPALSTPDTDSDGDGFDDAVEEFVGTSPLLPCNETADANDEATDAWPPDFNDDTEVDVSDVVAIRNVYGSSTDDGTYAPRFDLNADGQISVTDVVLMRNVYGGQCVPVPPIPPNVFAGQYYDSIDLTDPKLTRQDAAIDFDWGAGSPDPSIGPDTFSVRWTGEFDFDQADYVFTARSDDGMRVWIDGVQKLDEWHNQSPTTYTFEQSMTFGSHDIVVEYYEDAGNAVAEFSWQEAGGAQPGTRVNWQGNDWYLHGVNLPWYNWGCDFGCKQNGGVLNSTVNNRLHQEFADLQDADTHVVRWWMFPGNDPWQITESGGLPTGINPAVYDDLDEALALAEEYDIYYAFALFASPLDVDHWTGSESGRQALADALSELFQRYANHPRIIIWEVFNEPEWSIWDGQIGLAEVQDTVSKVAAAAHAETNAYVSVGSATVEGLQFWTGTGVDLYDAHFYDWMTGDLCIPCRTYADIQQEYGLDAPMVVGELYVDPRDIDALQRYETLYANGYAGGWGWSLLEDRTGDHFEVEIDKLAAFAANHGDIGPVSGPPPSATVEMWGQFEAAVTNSNGYSDAYDDVTLDVTYTRPDNSTVDFWGFYDGGDTWRIRFICDQLGVWSYAASFDDGSPGIAGSFECVPSTIPGMLSADETNPMWFGYKGGGHELIRSFHAGDRFFASNWSAAERDAFLDWAQGQGYNTLSIPSHYLNRDASGRGEGWDTPDLWDSNANRPVASEYTELEALMDDLADRRLLVYPFAGFFGRNSDYPTNEADQDAYVKYTLARLGSYWNILLNVAGPEPNIGWMSSSDVVRLGNEINSQDVFDHPLAVHNQNGDDPYKNSGWSSYGILQGPKTTSRSNLSNELLDNHHPSKPLYAQETLWYGNQFHPDYSDSDLRKNAFVINMSATALNFGDMSGNSSSGFGGSMDLSDRNQDKHDIIKAVWDFFETIPFYTMSPCQSLVSEGFCLANVGQEYLVYLEQNDTVDISITGGAYDVEWINAQNTADRRNGGVTSDGQDLTSPADGDDWLVHLTPAG